jgi:four helix bundle protein
MDDGRPLRSDDGRKGKSYETQTWLEFALCCKYIDDSTFRELDETYEHIFAMLANMEKKADRFCK